MDQENKKDESDGETLFIAHEDEKSKFALDEPEEQVSEVNPPEVQVDTPSQDTKANSAIEATPNEDNSKSEQPSPDAVKYSKEVEEIKDEYKKLYSLPDEEITEATAKNYKPEPITPKQSSVASPKNIILNAANNIQKIPKKVSHVYIDPTETVPGDSLETKKTNNSRTRLLVIIIPIAVIFLGLIGFGSYKIISNANYNNNFKVFNLMNNGYTYSFKFYKNGQITNRSGTNLVSGSISKTNSITAIVQKSSYSETCDKEFPNIGIVFTITFDGKSYPACSNPVQIIISTNVLYKNQWQNMIVYSTNLTSQLSATTAKTIMQSLSIR